MSNRPVIEKLRQCPLLPFPFKLSAVNSLSTFYVNGDGFLRDVWKFEAKLTSTTPVSVFDGIYHVVAAFERDIIPPGEGGFL